MCKTLALFGILGLAALPGLAQDHRAAQERAAAAQAREQAAPDPASERRVALRAALLAQREVAPPPGHTAPAERQLTEKERAELRRQLREQRRQ